MAYGDGQGRDGSGRLIVLTALVLSLAIFYANRDGNRSEGSFARSTIEDTAAPVLTYLSIPFQGLEDIASDRRARQQAFAENEALKTELRRLQDVERERNALERKLTAMSAFLEMPETESYTIVLARAVAETRGPFAQAALINAGKDKGVRAGAAVTSPQGLYGHVLRVGDRSARVLRLTDPESRIAVKNARSDARAIIRGDGSAMPAILFIDDAEDFADGDILFTSGDEGVMPEGLLIGEVRVDADTRTPLVELAETGRTADWVRVFVREAIVPPEDDALETVMRVKTIVVETPVEETEPQEPGSTIGGIDP